VLTGETGAGKSILVDALQLAAGGRAGAEVVRHGSERAEVTATFDLARARRRCASCSPSSRSTPRTSWWCGAWSRARASRAATSTASRCRCRRCGSPASGWSTSTASTNSSRWRAAAAQRDLLDEFGDGGALAAPRSPQRTASAARHERCASRRSRRP
jgi:hypothetical protein